MSKKPRPQDHAVRIAARVLQKATSLPRTTPGLVPPDHPALRTIASEVGRVTGAHRRTIADMLTVLSQHATGIGLAAPQIGISTRIIVIMGYGQLPLVVVNPTLSNFSAETVAMVEGCLSLPNTLVSVERPVSCDIHGRDSNGRPFTARLTGLSARVAQHEVDHLNGVLITDHQKTEP